jgi:hypothetical protein
MVRSWPLLVDIRGSRAGEECIAINAIDQSVFIATLNIQV